MRGAAIAFVLGTAAGAALVWRLSSPAPDASAVAHQLAGARLALSIAEQRISAYAEAKKRDRRERDSLRAVIAQRDSALVYLLERTPEVDTIWKTPEPGGPAVPVPVIAASVHDELRRECGLFRLDCAARIANLEQMAADDSIQIDSLTGALVDARTRLDTLPKLREPGRWAFGVAGPVDLSFPNRKGEPLVEARFGVCGPFTFRF